MRKELPKFFEQILNITDSGYLVNIKPSWDIINIMHAFRIGKIKAADGIKGGD